jgi:3'(2'), 5'-bisphosphate nucleotidase
MERAVAIEAVVRACRLCEAVRDALVTQETLAKKDKSPVTVADYSAQALVGMMLERAFPAIPLVGEEDTSDLRTDGGAATLQNVVRFVGSEDSGVTEERVLAAIDRATHSGGPSGRFWTLDPVDGTKGFLRGEQYAVALALIENGEVVLGVLGCPSLPLVTAAGGQKGCLFVAQCGDGSVVRPLEGPEETPIRVSTMGHPSQAVFCESVESGHSAHDASARVAALLGVTAPPVRMDSQCKYGAVARGDAAIYLRLPTLSGYEEKIWDHAAGSLVVKEAGGEVTDIEGRPLDFSRGRTLSGNIGVVATNGRLHRPVVEAIRRVGG